jgi:lysophospholipase L1-like esterase
MLCLACFAVAPGANAQPDSAVYPNNNRLREVFAAAKKQRIALVGIGDSNQLFNTEGWESAWTQVLRARYTLWGTALISAGEDYGWSSSVGTGATVQPASPTNNGSFNFGGAPVEACYWLTVFPQMSPAGYLYINESAAVEGQAPPHGMTITGNSGLELGGRLRFTFSHALFPVGRELHAFVSEGAWGGNIVAESTFSTDDPSLDAPPPPPQDHGEQPAAAPIDTRSIDLPVDPARLWSLRLWFGDERGRARGPFFLTYMQAENPDRTTGAAVHTLYGLGGASARDMAATLVGAPTEQLSLFFSRVRAPLGPNPKVVVRINSGVNDRSEWMPSVASNLLPGNSPAAFRDNLDAIMTRIRNVWAINNWDASELSFLLTVSHPLSEPDDIYLSYYRPEIQRLADRLEDVTVVDLSRLANANEIARRGWYNTPEDHYHLNVGGHQGIAERELIALVRRPCFEPADIDNNGAVNTRDLIALLEDFGQTALTQGQGGDLNADARCDTADLVQFLGRFGSQTCNAE